MEVECPACRKVNEMSDECLRCGCDLSSLRKIMESARLQLRMGAERLKNSDGLGALEHARKAWRLKKSAPAARLAFLACILAKKFDEATMWYGRGAGPK